MARLLSRVYRLIAAYVKIFCKAMQSIHSGILLGCQGRAGGVVRRPGDPQHAIEHGGNQARNGREDKGRFEDEGVVRALWNEVLDRSVLARTLKNAVRLEMTMKAT